MSDKKSEWNVSVGGVSVSEGGAVSVGGVSLPSATTHQGPAMGSSTLAAMGVQARKVAQSTAVMMGGASMSNQEVTRYELRLPVSPRIQASFRKESWGDAVVKIFKKELQTGDAAFDKLVYISTDTPERTQAFLTPEMREAVSYAIDMGGTLEIQNENVIAISGGIDSPGADDDRTVVKIVRALIDFAAT